MWLKDGVGEVWLVRGCGELVCCGVVCSVLCLSVLMLGGGRWLGDEGIR